MGVTFPPSSKLLFVDSIRFLPITLLLFRMYYLTSTKEKIPIFVNLRGSPSFETKFHFLILNEHVINAEANVILKNSLLRDKSDRYIEHTPLCDIQNFQHIILQFLKVFAACLCRMRRLFLIFVNRKRGC